MKQQRIILSSIAAAMALAAPFAAQAESNFATAVSPATATATARLNFRVVIPKFAFLQVGTGTLLANNATIDLLTFTVPAANVGNSTAVAATGGDAGGGSAVTVRVIGNNGSMSVGATAPVAGLSDGGTNNIPWSEFSVTNTGATAAPSINGSAITYTATGNVVNATGTWVYAYANATIPASGTYNGQVTYTATTP